MNVCILTFTWILFLYILYSKSGSMFHSKICSNELHIKKKKMLKRWSSELTSSVAKDVEKGECQLWAFGIDEPVLVKMFCITLVFACNWYKWPMIRKQGKLRANGTYPSTPLHRIIFIKWNKHNKYMLLWSQPIIHINSKPLPELRNRIQTGRINKLATKEITIVGKTNNIIFNIRTWESYRAPNIEQKRRLKKIWDKILTKKDNAWPSSNKTLYSLKPITES